MKRLLWLGMLQGTVCLLIWAISCSGYNDSADNDAADDNFSIKPGFYTGTSTQNIYNKRVSRSNPVSFTVNEDNTVEGDFTLHFAGHDFYYGLGRDYKVKVTGEVQGENINLHITSDEGCSQVSGNMSGNSNGLDGISGVFEFHGGIYYDTFGGCIDGNQGDVAVWDVSRTTNPSDDDNDASDDDIDDDNDDDNDDDIDDDIDDDNTSDDDVTDDDTTDEGVWTDSTSGLMWQNPPIDAPNWESAKNHCNDLSLAGYDDWRLPTISELRSLIRGCDATGTGGSCGVTDSCLNTSCEDGSCNGCSSGGGPAGGCYWPSELNGACSQYWSSSALADGVVRAWYVNFDDGKLHYYDTGAEYNVRCMRRMADL